MILDRRIRHKSKALIVDDERLARREMRRLLATFPEIEIIGEAESVRKAAELVRIEKPQIVFLDVQLSGETGFDLLGEPAHASFKTVFVTAFDTYAIRAFEVNALDFLLKPVNPERLAKTIEKLLHNERSPAAGNLRRLERDDRLFLELGGRAVFLKVNDISHIFAARDYSTVFTVRGEKFLVEKPLREWEARLPDKYFSRIHRGAIINLECVERIETWFKRSFQVRLRHLPEPIKVSRRYAARLKERFG